MTEAEKQKDREAVGAVLRDIRIIRNHPKAAPVARAVRAAYSVKIDSSYLSRMEMGQVEIPLRTLRALAMYYNVPAGTVLRLAWSGEGNDCTAASNQIER